jgi:hypothetical protein
MISGVKFLAHFGWVRDLMQMLPSSVGVRMRPPGATDLMRFRSVIRTQIDRILAAEPSLDETPSIFTHLRDSPDLPVPEKSANRLLDETVLMTMVGTYSLMLSLVVAHYHVVSNSDVMAKLRAELAAHPSAAMASQLQQLHMSAITQEAHRLSFDLTGRNARVCSDETLVYTHKPDGKKEHTYAIPPGTPLSSFTLVIHTQRVYIPGPLEVRPGAMAGCRHSRTSSSTLVQPGFHACAARLHRYYPRQRRDGHNVGGRGTLGYAAVRDDGTGCSLLS